MKPLLSGLALLFLVSCSLYKSPGRKFLEQEALNYVNDLVVISTHCVPEPQLEAPIGFEAVDLPASQLRAWSHRPSLHERLWVVSSNTQSCEIASAEPTSHRAPLAIQEIFYQLTENPGP